MNRVTIAYHLKLIGEQEHFRNHNVYPTSRAYTSSAKAMKRNTTMGKMFWTIGSVLQYNYELYIL